MSKKAKGKLEVDNAHLGCCHEESCGGAWLRPFRVPFHLFRVQTFLFSGGGGEVLKSVVVASGGGSGAMKRDVKSPRPPAGIYTAHVAVLTFLRLLIAGGAGVTCRTRSRLYIIRAQF